MPRRTDRPRAVDREPRLAKGERLLRELGPTARLVIAFVAAMALFGAAFAVGKATTAGDDEGAGASGPVEIDLPRSAPRLPDVAAPVPPPALPGAPVPDRRARTRAGR